MPCGEMMRRYWWPIALAENVKNMPVPIKLLGEEFVLFRDHEGQSGLVDSSAAIAAPRSSSAAWRRTGCAAAITAGCSTGRAVASTSPASRPIRATRRACARRPMRCVSNPGSCSAISARIPSAFPKYDLLVKNDCSKIVQGRQQLSNWLQRAENMMDVLHVMCLHASVYPELAMVYPKVLEWRDVWYGSEMYLEYPNGTKDKHHYVFPFINRVFVTRAGNEPYQFMQWAGADRRHPLHLVPGLGVGKHDAAVHAADREVPASRARPVQAHRGRLVQHLGSATRTMRPATARALSPIARARTSLPAREKGADPCTRKMIKDAIADVQAGKDPRGVIRDENHGDHRPVGLQDGSPRRGGGGNRQPGARQEGRGRGAVRSLRRSRPLQRAIRRPRSEDRRRSRLTGPFSPGNIEETRQGENVMRLPRWIGAAVATVLTVQFAAAAEISPALKDVVEKAKQEGKKWSC